LTLNVRFKELSRQLYAQIGNPSKDKCLVVSVVLCFNVNCIPYTQQPLFTLLPHISNCYQLFAFSPLTSTHHLEGKDFGNNTLRGNVAVCIYTPSVSFSLTYETCGREIFHFAVSVEKLDLVRVSAIGLQFKWKF
jgi:hypothetical protein